jgi:hypothetical protein
MLANLESAASRAPIGVLEMEDQVDDPHLGAIARPIAAARD